VKNLPFHILDTDLKELFAKFGSVRSLKVKRPDITHRITKLTAAYSIAYVDFENQEDAAKAKEEMNGKTIDNHVIQVEFYDKSQQ
jgi:RNA recognition motif-containing protein